MPMWGEQLQHAMRKSRQIYDILTISQLKKSDDILFAKQHAAGNIFKRPLTQQFYQAKKQLLHKDLRCLFVISVLNGTVPVSVFPNLRNRIYDTLQQLWLLLLYIGICIASFYELAYGPLKLSDLEHNFYLIEACLYFIQLPCIMLFCVRWRHKIEAVLVCIVEFDLASGYGWAPGSMQRFVRRQFLLVLLCLCLCIPLVIDYSEYDLIQSLCNWSTYVAPNAISNSSLVCYYTLLHGIFMRLQCLNSTLEAQLAEPSSALELRRLLHKLRWQHIQLLSFTKALNQTYGVCLLLIYTSSFVSSNCMIFLCYKSIVNPIDANWSWYGYIIVWVSMHWGKMFGILYFNNAVQKEQTRSLSLLSKLQTDCVQLTETINHFELQLKTDVRAHVACDLILLDLRFITGVS
ncbi:putative gustatory receptor 59f [Drosophila busckii]|uniref:putative gustatory receptor 59f n=1 Tax=Drosophila busckii TaxID=30019 RepID=UPI001432E0ED|nr:putative gustatory receptor 59f [Drosophila busckii]